MSTLNRRSVVNIVAALQALNHLRACGMKVSQDTGACSARVALTFDDGPDTELTPPILDILDEYNVQATFFVLGSKIEGNEPIIRRMIDSGHSVQNHTWDHPFLTQLHADQIWSQIELTNLAIMAAGAPMPMFIRPPYGDYDEQVQSVIEASGMNMVTWTGILDPRDWDGSSADEILRRITDNLTDTGVVLLHDIQLETGRALPEIITGIRDRGYCIEQFDGSEYWTLNV